MWWWIQLEQEIKWINEWKQQRIDNGNDDQMKEETLDLWNEEFQHQIDDYQKMK